MKLKAGGIAIRTWRIRSQRRRIKVNQDTLSHVNVAHLLNRLAAALPVAAFLVGLTGADIKATTQIVAVSGTPAPDGNGSFSGFSQLSLNDRGQVAFVAYFRNTSGGLGDNRGLFLSDSPGIVQLIRTGDIAPDGDTIIKSFRDHAVALNNQGQVAVPVALNRPNTSFDSNSVFVGDQENLTRVAVFGQDAPDGVGKVGKILGDPVLNDVGQAAFYAAFTGPCLGGCGDTGILFADGTNLEQIIREGDPAPDGDGAFGHFYRGVPISTIVLNDNGQAAFSAVLEDTERNTGIFRREGSTLTQIAREGDLAPSGDEHYRYFDDRIDLNDAGQVVFRANLTGSYGSDQGIFRSDGIARQEIAREGAAAPDGDGQFGFLREPDINEAGQVAFLGYLSGSTIDSGDPFNEFEDSGIYLYDDDLGLQQIARVGAIAPGGRSPESRCRQPLRGISALRRTANVVCHSLSSALSTLCTCIVDRPRATGPISGSA
jgi:hypothetical protein